MKRLVLVAVATAIALPVPGASPATPVCPPATVAERLQAADASFVGDVLETRPVGDQLLYTFAVDKAVKGELGSEVTVLSERLVAADGNAIAAGLDVGVFAQLDGGTYTTDSCGLVDPSLLLEAADEPRGEAIKLVVGMVILGAVLALALVRLRRRGDAEPAGRG